MAERGGRSRDRSGGRTTRKSSARRPERVRREGPRARLRRGWSAKRASGAARVLGLSNTRRAAVVAIVVCALAFTIAVPLRTYLSQRSEVAAEQQRRTALQDNVAELEARKTQLADPAQVQAEARRRLRYVMPGETPYMVQLPEDKQRQNPVQEQAPPPSGPWYERLWDQATG